MHRFPLTALAAIALLAGCPAPNPAKPDPGTGKASPRPSAGVAASAAPQVASGVVIAGLAVAPAGIVAAGAGNVIVDNAGNLVGADGASIVAAGAGNVVGPNGGQLLARRGLLAVEQRPLAGAEVFLAGADGQPLPAVAPAVADAEGRYRLTGVPPGETFTVQVRVRDTKNQPATLMTLVRPTAGGATANVSIGTHCVAVAVLDGQGGNLGEFNPAKFQVAVDATSQELAPGTWPDPGDRAAVLAAMSRLEAKIDLLQDTLEEIRAELKKLSTQVANGSPAPAASAGASAAPSGAPPASASPAASPPASAPPSGAATPGTVKADLALRAQLTGEGDTNMRVVIVEGDSDGGRTVGDDDGDVGGGFQIHVDTATFPATYRVYAQPDADDPTPKAVRANPANLLGVLVIDNLGAGRGVFTPRAGATIGLAGARLVPFFEAIATPTLLTGVLKWKPRTDGAPAPTGPFPIHVENEAGGDWSAKNPYVLDEVKGLGENLELAFQRLEIPARFRVEVTYTPPGTTTPVKEKAVYVRVHRDYVTDELRARFDREDGVDFDLDEVK